MAEVTEKSVNLGYCSYDVFGIDPNLVVCGGHDQIIVWEDEDEEINEMTPEEVRRMAEIAIGRWKRLIEKIDSHAQTEA